MKRTALFTSLLLSTISSAFAQKLEVSLFASSALMHYTGSYAVETTLLDRFGVQDPYGKRLVFRPIANFGGQVQAIIKSHFIGGVQLSLDNIVSETNFDHFAESPNVVVDGKSVYHTQFMNLTPYVGFRLTSGNFAIDLTPGFEFAFKIQGRTSAKMRDFGDGHYIALFDEKYTDIPMDLRARLGLVASYNRLGVNINYARGFSNYAKDNKYTADQKAYSEAVRIGLIYRIR